MKTIKDFKVGDRVSCITDGLHIECKILIIRDTNTANWLDPIKVEDIATGIKVWVSPDDIDYDKSYYRDKALSELGID